MVSSKVVAVVHLNKFTKRFVTIQLPYCVSMLLLTNRYKSATIQYTIKRCYYLVTPQSLSRKQIRTKPMLHLSFMSELKVFLKLY